MYRFSIWKIVFIIGVLLLAALYLIPTPDSFYNPLYGNLPLWMQEKLPRFEVNVEDEKTAFKVSLADVDYPGRQKLPGCNARTAGCLPRPPPETRIRRDNRLSIRYLRGARLLRSTQLGEGYSKPEGNPRRTAPLRESPYPPPPSHPGEPPETWVRLARRCPPRAGSRSGNVKIGTPPRKPALHPR